MKGCRINLRDRSIRITLLRAIRTISFWQKNELFSFLFSIQRPIYAEKRLEEIAGEVFVRERDQYIVYSIQFVVADAANEFLSNPSVAPPTIVVVVGKRHVRGVEYFFRGGL